MLVTEIFADDDGFNIRLKSENPAEKAILRHLQSNGTCDAYNESVGSTIVILGKSSE